MDYFELMHIARSDPAFWIRSLLLELLVALRFLSVTRFSSCIQWNVWQKLRNWWKSLPAYRMDRQTGEELDAMRCRVTRSIWYTGSAIIMAGNLFQQLRLLLGASRALPGLDVATSFVPFLGLLLHFRPQILNSRTLDAWHLATSLIWQAILIICVSDGEGLLLGHFSLAPLFAILSQRPCCFIFCMAVDFAQILWMAAASPTSTFSAYLRTPGLTCCVFFAIPVASCLAIRWLLHHYIVLRMDLRKRMVAELGAASSLLLVCFDTVVVVDETLKLTEDSSQLGGMLFRKNSSRSPKLHMESNSARAGQSLLDFFCLPDQDRICKQLASSVVNDATTMLLNADMLDADENRLPVQVVFTQFRNLSNASRFLVGLRELQDEVAPHATACQESSGEEYQTIPEQTEDEDLVVAFEVPSLEILAMSAEMELLCEQELEGKPETVLDISSTQARESFEGQLQLSINELANIGKQKSRGTISFNLRGLGDVEASIVLEHDEFLQCFVASIHIHGTPLESSLPDCRRLTATNLRRLQREEMAKMHAVKADIGPVSEASSGSRARSAVLRTSSQNSNVAAMASPTRTRHQL